MGKGDIKSRRGKLFSGSYGKKRPRKKEKKSAESFRSVTKKEKPETKVRENLKEEAKKPVRKTTMAKTPKQKAEKEKVVPTEKAKDKTES